MLAGLTRLRRKRELAGGNGGFTLIEIAVVLFVIALVTTLVIPYTKGFKVSQLKYAARQLAGRGAFLYDRASAGKLVLRLTFDLNTNSYFVTRLDPHAATPVFVPDLTPGSEPVILPSTVKIRDVTVEGLGTIGRGTISCNFYPEGYVDATVVHLIDFTGAVFTLTFEPLTGEVAIFKGDLNPEQAEVQAQS